MTADTRDLTYLNKALIGAADKGHTDIVKSLLALGADVHTEHEAPLRQAARSGHQSAAKALVKAGGDVSQALLYATQTLDEAATERLLEFMPTTDGVLYQVYAKRLARAQRSSRSSAAPI
jgi:ankyrin repeat protein